MLMPRSSSTPPANQSFARLYEAVVPIFLDAEGREFGPFIGTGVFVGDPPLLATAYHVIRDAGDQFAIALPPSPIRWNINAFARLHCDMMRGWTSPSSRFTATGRHSHSCLQEIARSRTTFRRCPTSTEQRRTSLEWITWRPPPGWAM